MRHRAAIGYGGFSPANQWVQLQTHMQMHLLCDLWVRLCHARWKMNPWSCYFQLFRGHLTSSPLRHEVTISCARPCTWTLDINKLCETQPSDSSPHFTFTSTCYECACDLSTVVPLNITSMCQCLAFYSTRPHHGYLFQCH